MLICVDKAWLFKPWYPKVPRKRENGTSSSLSHSVVLRIQSEAIILILGYSVIGQILTDDPHFYNTMFCLYFKIGDYSLKIHKSAYHLFSVFISKRGFSSLQTRKSFCEILSGNHRFLRPGIK